MLILLLFLISSLDLTNNNIDKIRFYESSFDVCSGENCTMYDDSLAISTTSALIKFSIKTEKLNKELNITFNNKYVKIDVDMTKNLPYEEAQKVILKSEKGIIEISDDDVNEQRAYFKTITEFDSNVRYTLSRDRVKNFCYCLKSLYDTYKSSKICYAYDVPIENYYHSQSKKFPKIIANDPATTINIYLPDNREVNEYKFSFTESYVSLPSSKRINFIAIDGTTSTKVYFSQYTSKNKYPIEISFSGLTSLRMKDDSGNKKFDISTLNINSIYLENSPITMSIKESVTVDNLYSDAISLRNNEGKFLTKSLFWLNESADFDGGNVYLQNNAVAVIEKVSCYPSIVFSGKKVKFVSIDENKFTIVIDGSNCLVDIRDKSTSTLHEEIIEDEPKVNLNVSFSINTNLDLVYNGISSSKIIYNVNSKYLSHKSISLDIGETYTDFSVFQFNYTIFNIVLKSVETARKFFENRDSVGKMITINSSNETLGIIFKNSSIMIDNFEINNDKIEELKISSISNLINIDSQNCDTIKEVEIISQFNGSYIQFGETISKMDKDKLSGLYINHSDLDITFNTSYDFVPFVNIEPMISGVLYEASTKEIEISSTTNFESQNTRTGDNLTINIMDDVTIPQSAILPKIANFELNWNTATIEYSEKSRTKYAFYNGKVIFTKSNLDNVFYYFNELEIINSTLKYQNNASLIVNKISFDLLSFSDKTLESITVLETCVFSDNTIRKIEFGNSSIKIYGKDSKTPIIYTDNQASNFFFTTSNNIVLSTTGTHIPENIIIELDIDDDLSIHFDKTWNEMTIPNGFKIKTDAKNIKITTDLLEFSFANVYSIENETKRTDLTIIEHKSTYSADLGFYILIGIAAFVLIISISLFFCKTEEMDVSSSFNSDESYYQYSYEDSYDNIDENKEEYDKSGTDQEEIKEEEETEESEVDIKKENSKKDVKETKEEEVKEENEDVDYEEEEEEEELNKNSEGKVKEENDDIDYEEEEEEYSDN